MRVISVTLVGTVLAETAVIQDTVTVTDGDTIEKDGITYCIHGIARSSTARSAGHHRMASWLLKNGNAG